MLTQTTDVSKATYFGGLYNYAVGTDFTGWQGIANWCYANGRVWAPSVGPGYIDDRAVPGNTTPTLARNDGATYDQIWSGALSPANGGPPTWVSITSFNEWHEGTMCEPASNTPPSGYGYQTFAGAYGTTGSASETAYLARTLYWVNQFTGGATTPPPTDPPPTTPPAGTDLALHQAVTATGSTQNYLPANAVDGDADSYWESVDNAFPQWIRIDLGAAHTIGRIVLGLPPSSAWGPRTETIAVQVSADGTTWTSAKGAAGYLFDPATGNTATASFGPVQGRFVRLTFSANTGWPAAQAARIEVYAS